MTTHMIYTSGDAEVTVPEGESIVLHFADPTVGGESVDLTEMSALLLQSGSTALEESTPADDHAVEFGTLECGDNVAFRLSGSSLGSEQALAILGEGVIAAIKAAVSSDR